MYFNILIFRECGRHVCFRAKTLNNARHRNFRFDVNAVPIIKNYKNIHILDLYCASIVHRTRRRMIK